MANEIYSKGQEKPNWLLWNMTEKVCSSGEFLPPLFFWSLVEEDARSHTKNSRLLVRITTNILLYLAACDYDITDAEATAITEITDKLSALCDSHDIPRSSGGLNPFLATIMEDCPDPFDRSFAAPRSSNMIFPSSRMIRLSGLISR